MLKTPLRPPAIPSDVLAPPEQGEIPSRWLWHGRPEWFNARALALRPFALFDQLIEPGLAPPHTRSCPTCGCRGIANVLAAIRPQTKAVSPKPQRVQNLARKLSPPRHNC